MHPATRHVGFAHHLACAAARLIAIIGAAAETIILVVPGVASLVSAFTLGPNSDALVGLALIVISTPPLACGIGYLSVTLLIRSKSPGWRVAAAILDSVLAWMIALLALHEALDSAVPFWAGTVRNEDAASAAERRDAFKQGSESLDMLCRPRHLS